MTKKIEMIWNLYHASSKLLDMMYTSGELAEELGVKREWVTKTLHDYYHVPAEIDSNGRLWFHGLTVQKWIAEYRTLNTERIKNRKSLSENEYYCLHCKARKKSDEYKLKPCKGGNFLKIAICPDCEVRMYKFTKGGEND